MFRPFVLDDTGRPFVELVAPDADAAIIAGQAYVGNGTADAVYLTTDAVAAADGIVGGFRYTTAGALRAYDATAGLPAGTSTNQGIAMTNNGQVCYSTAASGTYFNIAGVAVDSSSRVLIDLLTFELLFTDLGAGVVSTVEAINATTPTFTRATVSWTKLSTGLWAEVASGSPRSFYGADGNTVAGSYRGFFAEGAATQLLTDPRDMTTAAWTAAATITVSQTGTGIGGVANSCTRLTGGAVAATNTVGQAIVAAASTRTYSCWIRRVSGTGTINIFQDIGVGLVGEDVTAQINSATFTRVDLTASQLNAVVGIQIITDGDSIDVDFNQFEAGSFASSPIATTSTRNADILTYPTTGWISATAGTIFSHGTVGQLSLNSSMLELNDGTADNYIANVVLTSPLYDFQVANGGVLQCQVLAGTPAVGDTYKMASAYSASDFAMSTNGSAVGTDTSGTIPTVTTCQIGGGTPTFFSMFATIRRVAYYAVRLPNATLQELTA